MRYYKMTYKLRILQKRHISFRRYYTNDICDTGAQNPSLVDFDFFMNHITLHLLQNTVYRMKISCF